jgi:hypothetical protein
MEKFKKLSEKLKKELFGKFKKLIENQGVIQKF